MIPYYKILVNGVDRTKDYKGLLLSLVVTIQSDSNSDKLEFTIANPKWKIDLPKKSDQIIVSIGVDKDVVFYHAYLVDTITIEGGSNKVTIGGLACPFVDVEKTNLKAMQVSKNLSFHNLSIAAIVKTIASEVGVKAIVDACFDNIVDHFDLSGESYNAFLHRIAGDYGGMYKIANKKGEKPSTINCFLVFVCASSGNTASEETSNEPTIDCDIIGVKPGWKANLTARTDFTGIRCFYHDLATGDDVAVLSGTEKKVYAIKSPARNKEHAQQWADSLRKNLARGSQSIVFDTPARIDVTVEQFVQLKNFHSILDGKWLVKCITYKLTKTDGLVTSYQLEAPSPQ
ncbi:MAG: phage late control D family protein [Chthoniobacteraceae bacterium]